MTLKGAWEGVKLSWAEWHMIVSGWGDGAALKKGEKIPPVQETTEEYKQTDFYSILAREAWYYKFGMALGRLTWALIIAKLLERLIG